MSRELISLGDSLRRIEQKEEVLKKALVCYEAAFGDVEAHLGRLYPEKLGQPAPDFGPERQVVRAARDAEDGGTGLDRAKRRLGIELSAATEALHTKLAGMVELGEVLGLIEETSGRLKANGAAREAGFRGVADGLKETGKCKSVEEFRAAIDGHIRHISGLVEQMRNENEQILAELDQEMGDYRKKLDNAERMANTDPVTGLENRRGIEGRMKHYVESGAHFTLMIIDLKRFRWVNDRYGHLAGDELLRLFTRKLRPLMTGSDHAARWGGDEFVLVMEAPLSATLVRARQIEKTVTGGYLLEVEGQQIPHTLEISIGLAEARPGEPVEKVFSRADALLYRERHKG